MSNSFRTSSDRFSGEIVRRAFRDTPREMCEALFEAILHHDQIDEDATLPASICIDYPSHLLSRGFDLSERMWRIGVDRKRLRAIVRTIARDQALGAADLSAFKHLRARFKHLRFAFALFGDAHACDRRFDRVTTVMGRLQDMLGHGLAPRLPRDAKRLRFWTSGLGMMIVSRPIRRFRPTSSADFRAYIAREILALRQGMAEQTMSIRAFHDLRKIVSRQVALYDTLKILHPSPYHLQLSRYLGSLNGMMGAMHDDLVAARLSAGRNHQPDRVILPPAIAERLALVVDRHAELQEPGARRG